MKRILKLSSIVLLVGIVYYAWYVYFNYRFEEISPNKVYKSALIDPDKIGNFLEEYEIKTVVNLLDPRVQDKLNPAQQKHIDAEDRAIALYNERYAKSVKHINIPSGQIPNHRTLTKFFEVLDQEQSYPVLIHCYHGTGRAEMYSALYRIEYEQWHNAKAREKTRLAISTLGYKSSFADGRGKGDFLMGYKPRAEGNESTIQQLEGKL